LKFLPSTLKISFCTTFKYSGWNQVQADAHQRRTLTSGYQPATQADPLPLAYPGCGYEVPRCGTAGSTFFGVP
jgi:hypothetical protein